MNKDKIFSKEWNYLSERQTQEFLESFQFIFWDFDGVIKESVFVKTQGYLDLFEKYGPEVQKKVRIHHENNGGVSRLVKIPYYYKEYVGKDLEAHEIDELLEQYSQLTLNGVLQADWVEGVYEYIKNHARHQKFFIVTGTPTEDILTICEKLEIKEFFQGILGAPAKKNFIVKSLLEKQKQKGNNNIEKHSLFIGDAMADYYAARENGISFLLRETNENLPLFSEYFGLRVKNFL